MTSTEGSAQTPPTPPESSTHRATSYLSPTQHDALLRPINPRRVGKDGKGYSHVEAYEVRAHCNRIFGFARWSAEVTAMEHVSTRDTKTAKGKDAVEVIYRAQCRLTVRAPDGTELATYVEWACGDAVNPSLADAHDQAVKTAESQAFKRAATNLGDQFGLSLYNSGAMAPLVRRSLLDEFLTAASGQEAEVDAHIDQLAREDAPPTVRETSAPLPVEPQRAATPDTIDQEAIDQEAIDAIQASFPGAGEVRPSEAVEEIGQLVLKAKSQGPQDAMQTLKEALELAVAKGVRQSRLPNGETVGAALTRMLGEASRGDAA